MVGDGGGATTLSLLLANKGYHPRLWGAFPRYVDEMQKKRENFKFLPGFHIPENLSLTSDLSVALESDYLVLAVPSQFMRPVLKRLKKKPLKNKTFVVVAKGVETRSLKVMSQVVREVLGSVKLAVLSGPNIAREVALKMPAAASVASNDARTAKRVREIFSTEYFTLFESSDMLGVELGGSLKNVIAL